MVGFQPILAYHGCDQEIAERILLGKQEIQVSKNDYDWLGKGAYFWENDPIRALDWAKFIASRPQHAQHKIHHPTVIGAILAPGNCLDLTDMENLRLIKQAHAIYSITGNDAPGTVLPVNKKGFSGDEDLIKRYLDCAVINFLHEMRDSSKSNLSPPFDSVRGIFMEGGELYPGAKIMSRTHVQICIRRPETSVIGYFLPRTLPDIS